MKGYITIFIKSIMPLLLKVYERVIYEKTSNYFEPFFNEVLSGFFILKLLTSWQNSLNRGGFVGFMIGKIL